MAARIKPNCVCAVTVALVCAIAATQAATPGTAQVLTGSQPNMTPEEQAERDGRKACKVQICSALHDRKPGDDISCDIVKSWRTEILDKVVGKAAVSWPWGRVMCKAPIKLKRDIPEGGALKWADVAYDPNDSAVKVRREMEAMFSRSGQRAAA